MTNWVLRCPNCSKKFVHSKIEDTLANYFLPAKPKFSKGGQRLTCSHCGKESLFQQTDLTYEKESFKSAAGS
jgi:DNA-directed RNA polymerase subunit RPC12/RpoP